VARQRQEARRRREERRKERSGEKRGAEKREERDWAADMAGIKIDSIKKDRMRIGMPRQHNAKRKRLNAKA
jgi:hypothetical protein